MITFATSLHDMNSNASMTSSDWKMHVHKIINKNSPSIIPSNIKV